MIALTHPNKPTARRLLWVLVCRRVATSVGSKGG